MVADIDINHIFLNQPHDQKNISSRGSIKKKRLGICR